MFECLGIIFEIIEYDKNIKENNIILNKLIEKKNAKFVEVKSIEHKIRNYYKNIKKIQSHIKKIHTFYDTFKELKINTAENNVRDLIEKIKEFKNSDFDYNNNFQNYDAITSLTFGTYCTQSEDSSIKSSTLSSNNKILDNKISKQNNIISPFKPNELTKSVTDNMKSKKKNFNKIFKDNKNNKYLNKNDNSRDNKKTEITDNNNKYIIKSKNNNYVEIKENKLTNQPNKNIINKEKNKNKFNIYENDNNKKNEKEIINKNHIEEEKKENDKDNNNITKIEEEKEILEKKTQINFSNLQFLGSKINQLKYRDPDESIEMTMPKENTNKNYNIINTEYNLNDSSVCDEMISFNYERTSNLGRRNSTNDYINKIGVKNNVVLSQELYRNKLFMRRNNNEHGKLKIEKAIESSACCVSCT
jgi:hypothetical protein